MLKAIETRYKGYRFRSRLEARWAVFFSALGVAWVYEAEGYDLGIAGWYLPDFVIRKELWAEIKPETPSLEELSKAKALAAESNGVVIVAVGTPGEEKIYLLSKEDSLGPDTTNGYPVWCDLFHSHYRMCSAMRNAYAAARSARFEHGEQP